MATQNESCDALRTDQKLHTGVVNVDGDHCESSDCWCWQDRYMVVTRESSKDLMEAVNAFIHQKDWKPLGGVSHQEREEYQLWAQAMVRHL